MLSHAALGYKIPVTTSLAVVAGIIAIATSLLQARMNTCGNQPVISGT